ncbi:MAG TPA: hypothetical protein VJ757_15645, partial [Pseudonocardiaceae bacterium]|nr:hypothetical protein [Pseudonocardiaceae bacterium]
RCCRRCCPGYRRRARARCRQQPFTRRLPTRRRNLASSLPFVPSLAGLEELLVDVLAAGLALLFEVLVVQLLRRLHPAP